jgi:hypothetical protein
MFTSEEPVKLTMPGPAHAIYFATYEAVKHAMGGNQAGVHHPLAAGVYLNVILGHC